MHMKFPENRPMLNFEKKINIIFLKKYKKSDIRGGFLCVLKTNLYLNKINGR